MPSGWGRKRDCNRCWRRQRKGTGGRGPWLPPGQCAPERCYYRSWTDHYPPFQGPRPDGGVVLTFPAAVGGQPLGRGVYHAALTGQATGPSPVLQIAVRPALGGIHLQRLIATPPAVALW